MHRKIFLKAKGKQNLTYGKKKRLRITGSNHWKLRKEESGVNFRNYYFILDS